MRIATAATALWRHRRARAAAPPELDVLVPARAASSIAPLLARSSRISSSAWASRGRSRPTRSPCRRTAGSTATRRFCRGIAARLPVAWAIRKGDEEIGITFHRMDAELDTGPILAQRTYPARRVRAARRRSTRGSDRSSERRSPRRSRARVRRRGRAQEAARQLRDVLHRRRRLARSLAPRRSRSTGSSGRGATACPRRDPKGALLELDGTPVRVLATSLDRGRGSPTRRVRRRAALDRRDRGAQRGRGHAVQRSGSIHAVKRRVSRLRYGCRSSGARAGRCRAARRRPRSRRRGRAA